MNCEFMQQAKCIIASELAGRDVFPEPLACQACLIQSLPKAVNSVTNGMAIAVCFNSGDKDKAFRISESENARRKQEKPRKPYKLIKPKQAAPTQLVGDSLTALIREYGIKPVKSCGCDSWKQKLNEWGIEGCMSNRQAIIDHLSDAYHAATWWQTLTAAGNAAYKSLPLTLGGMVDEAIRRTETPLGN